uniref:Fes1 domain-containing protein n=1 Tax=Globodera pallida TaxID=36090 RepID=A0A183CM49_GLOPA
MSINNNTHPNPSSSANVPVLNQLLAVATQAQGDSPADQTHSFSQMPEEDRAWLEAALSHIAADSDPVKKLKRWMARLEEVGEPSEANLGDIGDILEEIGDLVCDIDMAQCFCSLNGISLIQRLLLDGPDKLMRCFEDGVGMADNTKLAHRCVVAAVALKRSFSVEVVNIDSNFRRVVQCPAEMRAKLVETNGDTKWNDTLEFLAE